MVEFMMRKGKQNTFFSIFCNVLFFFRPFGTKSAEIGFIYQYRSQNSLML